MSELAISKAELARQLGVSRTYITLLTQGKRQPSQQLANKIRQLQLTAELPVEFRLTNALVGKRGLEPRRLAAHDPKSCSSASSDTPPDIKSFNILAHCLTFCLPLWHWLDAYPKVTPFLALHCNVPLTYTNP